MQHQLNTFSFEGKGLRVLVQDGQPWWIATEVGEVLGLKGHGGQIVQSLEDAEKGVRTMDTPGGIQEVICINESGLYALIFKSRKPEAKRFRVWVTSEVLPAIRKTGSFTARPVNPANLSRLELLTMAMEAEKERMTLAFQVENQAEDIRALEPKAVFHDRVADAEGCHSIQEAAQLLGTGQNRLFQWLRESGFIIPGTTKPYQQHVDAGLLKVVEKVFEDAHGIDRLSAKTLVTGKGLVHIQKKLQALGLIRPQFSGVKA